MGALLRSSNADCGAHCRGAGVFWRHGHRYDGSVRHDAREKRIGGEHGGHQKPKSATANDVISRRHTRRHHVPPSRLFKVLQAHVGWLRCVSRAHLSPRGRCARGNASLKRRFRVEGTNCRVARHSFARYAHRDGVKGRRRGRSLRVSTRKRVRVVIRIV